MLSSLVTSEGIEFYKKQGELDYNSVMKKELKYELKYGRLHPLTNLPDRRKFLNALNNSQSNKLALLNINGFSNFNHTFGYDIGDEILTHIAKRIEKRFSNAAVFHLESDTFAVLAGKELSEATFLQTIESCIWYFGYSPIEVEAQKLFTPLRIGVAMGEEELFLNAEFALKTAKRIGKNLFIHNPENASLCRPHQNRARENLEWESTIRQALKKNRFEVYAQSIEGGRTKKYECLVRMRDTDGKVISPYFFLEHAKRANLYESITKLVIKQSFEFFADKKAEFSINLSLSDILDKHTVDYLLEKMYEYSVAEKLTIELTESEGIDNHPEVLSFLTLLKKEGVKIAIDDFGTGYSNFEYLVKLQADYIKIDGSIIKNITKNETHRAVVEAIVAFAKKVGMQTIAEFVSTSEIYKACQEEQIDYFQGYLFSEPVALNQLLL